MALLINRKDVEQLLTMKDAVEAVEEGFRAMGEEPLLNHPRRRLHWRPGDARKLNIFAGSLPEVGYIGVLARFDYPNRPDSRRGSQISHPPSAYDQPFEMDSHGRRVVYNLYDEKGLVAILYGGSSGRGTPIKDRAWTGDPIVMRTAATSAVGTKLLARADSKVMGFFGTGYYAPSHFAAMTLVCPAIKQARVYSPNEEHRRVFAREIQKVVDIEIAAVSSPAEAIEGADLIVCCTNSVTPVLEGSAVEDGCHVTGIVGQNNYLPKGEWWGAREVDDELLQRCRTIFVSSIEQAEQDQQATTWDAVRRGILSWDKVRELGDLAAGKCQGREHDEEVTFYQNNAGQGIADLALAIRYYQLALEHRLGFEMDA